MKKMRGAALLAAMLTVTLVASFAAAAAWQQWRAVEIEAAERARAQASWILVGALDWSRLILREDARSNSGGADHLGEPWAVPLQEARLSSFLAADKNNTALSPDEEGVELFLSGQIVDMQSRLNVQSLVVNGTVSQPALKSFVKLFDLLNLDPLEVVQLADNLRMASAASNTSTTSNLFDQQSSLKPQRVEQLVWLGLSQSSLDQLKPFITILPTATPINVNTAPVEVLYASVPSLDLNGARQIEAKRAQQHFRNLGEAGLVVPAVAAELNAGQHSIATKYFEVRGRLRLAQTIVQERSLVERNGLDVKTLWRERAALPKLEGSASLQ
jgi:general secretion pathway protein K